MLSTRDLLHLQGHVHIESDRIEKKKFHENGNKKKVVVAIHISEKNRL